MGHMTKCMHKHVFAKTCITIQNAKFILINFDEVTTIDCQSWMGIHVYVVEGWKHIHI